MSGIPESKKPRVTSGIDNMIDECSKWYHNTQEWYEDSWDSGVSCNEQIRNEMNKVDEAYELLQKQNQELIEALTDALEVTESLEDDMQHYFDNGCCPTISELNQVFSLTLRLKEVLAKFSKGDL